MIHRLDRRGDGLKLVVFQVQVLDRRASQRRGQVRELVLFHVQRPQVGDQADLGWELVELIIIIVQQVQ